MIYKNHLYLVGVFEQDRLNIVLIVLRVFLVRILTIVHIVFSLSKFTNAPIGKISRQFVFLFSKCLHFHLNRMRISGKF